MSSSVPPASSTAALRFSHTWRVCASMSPMPAIEPSAQREVMPEMNTIRPSADTMVAWEKCPLGWASFFGTSCCLGIAVSSAWRATRLVNESVLHPFRHEHVGAPDRGANEAANQPLDIVGVGRQVELHGGDEQIGAQEGKRSQ